MVIHVEPRVACRSPAPSLSSVLCFAALGICFFFFALFALLRYDHVINLYWLMICVEMSVFMSFMSMIVSRLKSMLYVCRFVFIVCLTLFK